MSDHVDPLVVERVVGDVVEMFMPTVPPMSVCFSSKGLTNGCNIKPSIAVADHPLVQIASRVNDLFTLMLQTPASQARGSGSTGEAVVPYMGPRPLVGIHRYVLAVYQQKARMAAPPALAPEANQAVRECFSSRAFAGHHDLGRPVAAMYFKEMEYYKYGLLSYPGGRFLENRPVAGRFLKNAPPRGGFSFFLFFSAEKTLLQIKKLQIGP
ncbi:Protein MOTHER of FT and TFL1-like protein 1 [Dichanthelium oligosanthes]|uniref:Protein MOTHER of FT and TFL1-like protein 1 n=1 Tax=Dichanthelium oligosanthes TaxID=888268 RepID=A0A1E5V8F1_9POAL|nr:Protein MOTHER of FT and TFL1-like protein 1 [Dichanthelium oligosanthes]